MLSRLTESPWRTLGRSMQRALDWLLMRSATFALPIHRAVERGGAIEHGPHQAALLDVDVLDTAFAFEELFVLTGLSRPFRKQERTTIALGVIALGVQEAVGRMHA